MSVRSLIINKVFKICSFERSLLLYKLVIRVFTWKRTILKYPFCLRTAYLVSAVYLLYFRCWWICQTESLRHLDHISHLHYSKWKQKNQMPSFLWSLRKNSCRHERLYLTWTRACRPRQIFWILIMESFSFPRSFASFLWIIAKCLALPPRHALWIKQAHLVIDFKKVLLTCL